jgi:hypothetical protein
MKVEYDFQDDYDVCNFYKLSGNVEGAFRFVGTEITICPDSVFLPDDLEYFTPQGQLRYAYLWDFANAHKTKGQNYHLISVNRLDANDGFPPPNRQWGFTPWDGPNIPPDPKWSLVFVGDIPEEQHGGQWTKHRLVTATTIHELGHQRAGLTHPNEHQDYHISYYPCIMNYNGWVTDQVLTQMGFCWSTNPDSVYNCKYFLQQRNNR